MSLQNQVNNTVAKLVQKYNNTTWATIMSKVLNDKHFRKGLSTLMENHSKGIKFSPGFNEIFKTFDNNSLDTTKIVVIYPSATEQVPAYESKEGVLLIRTPLTESEGVDSNKMWDAFVRQLLDEIAYKTLKTVFIFVGKDTEKYKGITRKGQFKFFVPIEPEFDISKVYNNVNDLLKKIDKEPVGW
jgi:uracil DNA glycosylase